VGTGQEKAPAGKDIRKKIEKEREGNVRGRGNPLTTAIVKEASVEKGIRTIQD